MCALWDLVNWTKNFILALLWDGEGGGVPQFIKILVTFSPSRVRGSCFGRIFHRQQMLRSMQMYGGRYRDRVFFPLSTCVRAVLPRRREGVLWSADRPWSKMLLQEGEMRSKDRGLVSTTLRYRKSSERNTVYSSLTWFRRQIVGWRNREKWAGKKNKAKTTTATTRTTTRKNSKEPFLLFFSPRSISRPSSIFEGLE